jgi:hypothetical protein
MMSSIQWARECEVVNQRALRTSALGHVDKWSGCEARGCRLAWKQVRVEFLDQTLRVPSKLASEGGKTRKRKLLIKVGMERCVTRKW